MSEEKKIRMKVDNGGMGSEYKEVDFPGNSKKQKQIKVVTTNAKVKKPGIGSRILATFVGDNIDDAAGYVIHDVLIPGAKNMFFDGLETLFFGRPRSGRKGSSRKPGGIIGGGGYVSYDDHFRGAKKEEPRHVQPRAAHTFNDIEIEDRADAEEVLLLLAELVDQYGAVSVADLYRTVGKSSQYTDNNYGWVDLSTAGVRRTRFGYLLDLPRPILL